MLKVSKEWRKWRGWFFGLVNRVWKTYSTTRPRSNDKLGCIMQVVGLPKNLTLTHQKVPSLYTKQTGTDQWEDLWGIGWFSSFSAVVLGVRVLKRGLNSLWWFGWWFGPFRAISLHNLMLLVCPEDPTQMNLSIKIQAGGKSYENEQLCKAFILVLMSRAITWMHSGDASCVILLESVTCEEDI